MPGRIVKCDCLIMVFSAFPNISSSRQTSSHQPMPNHARHCRPLLLGKLQKPRRKLTHHVTVEGNEVGDPGAVEDREQEQWILGRLSECFSSFDQEAGPFDR